VTDAPRTLQSVRETEAAKDAVRATIRRLEEERGLQREEAYALFSVAVDLRTHELVDAPNWVVGEFLPDDLFEQAPPAS
jgi:acetamidase/formamidase